MIRIAQRDDYVPKATQGILNSVVIILNSMVRLGAIVRDLLILRIRKDFGHTPVQCPVLGFEHPWSPDLETL
jgi:hypothetical protein